MSNIAKVHPVTKEETSKTTQASEEPSWPYTWLVKHLTCRTAAITCLVMTSTSFALAFAKVATLYLATQKHTVKICETEECLRMAHSLKESMDLSIDPCKDFYNFTCGKWAQSHSASCVSSEDSVTWFDFMEEDTLKTIEKLLRKNSSSSEAPLPIKQAKTLYTSCMNTDRWEELGLEPLYSLLKQLELPIVDFTNISNTMSTFVAKLAKVHRTMNLNVFFEAEPKEMENILNLRARSVSDSWTSSGIRSTEDSDFNFANLYKIGTKKRGDRGKVYNNVTDLTLRFITDVVSYVLKDAFHQAHLNTSSKQLEVLVNKTVNTICSVEKAIRNELSKLPQGESDEGDHTSTLDNFDKKIAAKAKERKIVMEPLWVPFVKHLFQDLKPFDFEEKVLISNSPYLEEIAMLISSSNKIELTTYLWWMVVKHSVPYLTNDLQNIYNKYYNQMSLKSKKYCKRYVHCTQMVSQLMDKAILSLYAKEYLKEPLEKKKEMEDLVGDMFFSIKSAFATSVNNVSWADVATKMAVNEKIRRESILVMFPSWILNEEQLRDHYKGLDISSPSFLKNLLNAVRQRTEHYWLTAGPTNSTKNNKWLQINAFHIYQNAKIILPFGILQFPFYEDGLKVLNYAGIGTVIGHEILHGFDYHGIWYNGDGTLGRQVTVNDAPKYVRNLQCFMKDYSSFYEPKVGRYVDSTISHQEIIADNGGIKVAFKAYQTWAKEHETEAFLPGFTNFTHEQLFFLAYGHNLCASYSPSGLNAVLDSESAPNHVRMQMVIQNSEDFGKVWKCPAGSRMNPEKKCSVW